MPIEQLQQVHSQQWRAAAASSLTTNQFMFAAAAAALSARDLPSTIDAAEPATAALHHRNEQLHAP
jgi:hypothetical protein